MSRNKPARRSRWLRRVAIGFRRGRLARFAELAALIVLIGTALASYLVVTSESESGVILSPPAVAALLVANLVPAMALMVLVARRIAMRRAAQSPTGGRGRMHVRLVAFFSVVASVPTLMVVIFASLLFQSGNTYWFSERARTTIENTRATAIAYRDEQLEDVQRETAAMGSDMVTFANQYGFDHPQFEDFLIEQTSRRGLVETALLAVNSGGEIQNFASINLYDRPLEDRFSARELLDLEAGEVVVKEQGGDRVEAAIRLDPEGQIFLYTARDVNPQVLTFAGEADRAASEYQELLSRAQLFQLRFNAALLIVALLIVGFAIWVALALADRMVRPVGQLVQAARRVTAGDLSARVPNAARGDEVGTLGTAFNRMTERLEAQTGALVTANTQSETRRALLEAVLSGVTAGIISVDQNRVVRLANPTAEALLRTSGLSPVGQKLADVAPELDQLLSDSEAENIVQFATRGDPRTLAVKTVAVEGGHVLTFDDITEQLLDQRRAAWSDVARRIAHEIKNPLTPIQLAAERLQRRYGAEVTSDPATFERLTGTIVRQVGDLRRMVDEFSSFARMPKPVFQPEALTDVARQALFLHEVAHPGIKFSLDAPEPSPVLVCDRRHLGQALTNIVKNGVEAIEQKNGERGGESEGDRIAMRIVEDGSRLTIEVEDTGVGPPADRGRITEPYMTTRTKGTGLGLAIVKKIVEEHFGQVEFADAPGGGTLVRLVFDAETLARLSGGGRIKEENSVGG
ncbi:MAG TPA: PAS domain-containing sensor histidine kinase [Allosphingosinicella sp.]